MSEECLEETRHLEQWIVHHPEVIDEGLKIVASQYNRWVSVEGGSAKEALDVLALSSSGQTVVIELKRGSDRKVHLQAITYEALVAGFDRHMLADAHAHWLTKNGAATTAEEALEQLTEHLESGWDDEILKLPRLVLVAESFPDQVLTTVQWLADTVAHGLEIECHEYSLFRDNGALYSSFQKIFPVENLEGRTLRPAPAVDTGQVRERIATRERRARSVKVIAERRGIPDHARIELNLDTLVKSEIVAQIDDWLAAESSRRSVTWVNDKVRPLLWAAAEDPSARWTPTALRDEIFAQAGVSSHNFSAADGWQYQGQSLYWFAQSLLNRESDEAETS
ncbi:DNA-binding protein [Brevibacterium sp. 2SA]|uniref:DNA-binding protein n=2 Tax=unclassified Brevibacterium TaxID=2614124 RepID=UPI0010F63BBE|nr:DNA-binding protein [Brevibacterium sp. 2SA]